MFINLSRDAYDLLVSKFLFFKNLIQVGDLCNQYGVQVIIMYHFPNLEKPMCKSSSFRDVAEQFEVSKCFKNAQASFLLECDKARSKNKVYIFLIKSNSIVN